MAKIYQQLADKFTDFDFKNNSLIMITVKVKPRHALDAMKSKESGICRHVCMPLVAWTTRSQIRSALDTAVSPRVSSILVSK